jgi:hypothetical protein
MATTITYFIDTETLTEFGFTQSNVNSKVLNASIIRCQDRFIEPLLGSPLYEEIGQAIRDESLTNDQTTLLDKYIRPLLTAQVEIRVARRVTQQIRNKTAGRGSDETIQASDNDQLTDLRDDIKKDVNFYTRKLVGYLCDNDDIFPKYKEYRNNFEDVARVRKPSYSIGTIRRNKRTNRTGDRSYGYDWDNPDLT